MIQYPHHINGIPALVPTTVIASFPIGTFLENIAVQSNGTLLVSDILNGKIYYIDPHSANQQSTVRTVYDFNKDISPAMVEEIQEKAGAYGLNNVAEAKVEDHTTPDIFYTFSGIHGKPNTWAVYRLDLRNFDPSSATPSITANKIANIPEAHWLNGAIMLPNTSTLLIAESLQGKLISCSIRTGKVETWLENDLFGKSTDRPKWPGINGVQYFNVSVYATWSDRNLLLRATVDPVTGTYIADSLVVLAENLSGDDLAFDEEGSA